MNALPGHETVRIFLGDTLAALLPAPCQTPLATSLRLGVVHALVDCASVATVWSEATRERMSYDALIKLILLYNAFAFGWQWLIGLLADRRRLHARIGRAGPLLIALAIMLEPFYPWLGIVLCGTGNGCFHAGAGAIVLQESGGRATEPGVFVAPGTMGVVMGVWLGVHAGFWQWPGVALLVLASVLVSPSQVANGSAKQPVPGPTEIPLWGVATILLLGSILIRSLIGGHVGNTWEGSSALAAASALGKGCGGFLADRFGWRKVGTLSLLIAAPLLAAGVANFSFALVGVFIFQWTMSITLAAIFVIYPQKAGLTFGLASLALLMGAVLPRLAWTAPEAFNPWVAPVVLFSALLFFLASALSEKNECIMGSGLNHPLMAELPKSQAQC